MTRRLGLVAAALLLAACSTDAPAPEPDRLIVVQTTDACRPPLAVAATGETLPDLTFPCLGGGPDLELAAAPGEPTVLNLWASWCGPCRDELPLFQQLHDRAGDLVSTVGLVEMDTRQSSLAYAEDVGISFPSALDQTGMLLSDQGLRGLPVTYFLRADGSVAHREIGPITDYDELRTLIAEHLDVSIP